MLERLARISCGFRGRYLRYEELAAQLSAWAEAFPDLVRVRSIGKTPEGRDLLLAIVGDEEAPAVWIDANMHAGEFSGTNVALGMLEDLLALRLGADVATLGLPPALAPRLRGVTAFVLPRMSPDGAEVVLERGRWVRSAPRDRRLGRSMPYWVQRDLDGDGLALVMRRRDPTGDYAESRDFPGLLLPRLVEDEGPFFQIYPEGHIENWDGFTIPAVGLQSDTETDLNRNFPYMWFPEPEQLGAGDFPGSEPESRAVIEFASRHANIFAWLNLHTFGGVYIRPLGDAPDKKMDQGDLALFRQIERWNEEATGYPTVSGYEEFTYEPEKPLRGDLSEWAYHQRGALGYVCELWDVAKQAGLPTRRPFIDTFHRIGRDELLAIARWDREHNASRVLRPWRRFEHPQLGEVELGGLDPRIGLWNPPPDRLGEMCREQAKAFLRVASMVPAVQIDELTTTKLDGGMTRIDAVVRNHGYLATHGVGVAKKLPWNEAIQVRLTCDRGVTVVSGHAKTEIGHLDGWGHGAVDDTFALALARSHGNGQARRATWVVRGSGDVTVSASSVRIGRIEQTLRV